MRISNWRFRTYSLVSLFPNPMLSWIVPLFCFYYVDCKGNPTPVFCCLSHFFPLRRQTFNSVKPTKCARSIRRPHSQSSLEIRANQIPKTQVTRGNTSIMPASAGKSSQGDKVCSASAWWRTRLCHWSKSTSSRNHLRMRNTNTFVTAVLSINYFEKD